MKTPATPSVPPQMSIIATAIPDVLIIEPRVFEDDRGWFYESYNEHRFAQSTCLPVRFVQDNHVMSSKNVVRGLHYQIRQSQGKLMRVTAGEIFDVSVDLRRHAPTFGRWVGVRLSAANRRQLWVPAGFAHGYVVLSEHAECQYKTTDYRAPEHERILLWDDPALGINWPIDGAPTLSERDRNGTPLCAAEIFERDF